MTSAFFALLLLTPMLALTVVALSTTTDTFVYIQQTVLSDYVINTMSLIALVSVLVVLIGVPIAWLLASCEFPGKAFFNWALILPLAMPGYLIAYVYTDLLDYSGPVQVWLRATFGWASQQDYTFFEIRSLGGAAVMLALVLFPYVLLLCKASFSQQPASFTFASRSLGRSPLRSFFQVSLPMARKAVFIGVLLVAMETMADFATVHYFAVNTLTTAVYDTWLGYYDLASAAKLSLVMVVGVIAIVVLERLTQKRSVENSGSSKVNQASLTYNLTGMRAWSATLFCSLILMLGFGVPAITLFSYAIDYADQVWHLDVLNYAWNSFKIAVLVAVISVVFALLFNANFRHQKTPTSQASLNMSNFGYAVPGTVLAIAVLVVFSYVDGEINELFEWLGADQPGLILSGTIIAIVVTHIVRFIAIANNAVADSYQKINEHLDWASASLGHKLSSTFRNVHWPLLKRGVFVSALLIFVESMKELPAALLLRPFDFDTLPTYVYQFASDEQLEQASLGALLIVLVGLIPLLYINRSIENSKKG